MILRISTIASSFGCAAPTLSPLAATALVDQVDVADLVLINA
jgi:hypothetical protein